MTYTVVWKQVAEDVLTLLWIKADDREAITAAANQIDQLLRSNPELYGESREGNERVWIVPPLVVVFEVQDQDRIVTVLSVRFLSRDPQE
jgi:hypothetical protein